MKKLIVLLVLVFAGIVYAQPVSIVKRIYFYTWHYDFNADLMPAFDIRGDETDYFEVNDSDYSEIMPITGSGKSAGWELDGNDDLQPVS